VAHTSLEACLDEMKILAEIPSQVEAPASIVDRKAIDLICFGDITIIEAKPKVKSICTSLILSRDRLTLSGLA
jgi:hypothetical protein